MDSWEERGGVIWSRICYPNVVIYIYEENGDRNDVVQIDLEEDSHDAMQEDGEEYNDVLKSFLVDTS